MSLESFIERVAKMERYSFSARILHWFMAVCFGFMWACGYAMTRLVSDDSAAQETLFSLHISMGVLLFFLVGLRIAIRFITPPPAPVAALENWEKLLAHLGHLALYALPLMIIVIGWAETDFGGHGTSFFGLTMPKVFPTMETLWGINLETTTATIHRWLAYTMLVVVVGHVAAVVKHRLEGHDVLERMMFK
ncbi:cytochrome b/b6 domain-containing protein [Tropicibacter sp. R16_0]|uniref:cytochrome b n=1 Tax=Tropicibacter sp. R16_0 TaxID=2821102 RepID=UPI002570FCDA|nr:cytochrome b/b6 domain-containing protein [Tropicibacter sp. R16_0]